MMRGPVGDARRRPMPLFVLWAITPATKVPWPLRSYGSVLLRTKSWPRTKRLRSRSGARHVAAVRRGPVGDAGVEHRHGHAAAARVAGGDRVVPGGLDADPERAGEVPLQGRPAARAAAAGIVGREGGRARRRSSARAWTTRGSALELAAGGGRVAAGRLDPLGAPVDRARRTRTPAARRTACALRRRWCPRGTSRPARPGRCGAAAAGPARVHARKASDGRQEAKMDPPEHVTPGEIRYYKPHRML